MKNNSTRFIAILAAAATLATGASFATTASAAEPVTSQVNLSMDVTDMTDDMLLGMLDPEIRSSGFLDNVENWTEDKIAGFLKDQGGDSSTAHSVAKIIVGILL